MLLSVVDSVFDHAGEVAGLIRSLWVGGPRGHRRPVGVGVDGVNSADGIEGCHAACGRGEREREATRILMVCARRAASVLRALCPEKAGAAGDRRCDVECGLQVGYDGGSRHSCRGLEYRG